MNRRFTGGELTDLGFDPWPYVFRRKNMRGSDVLRGKPHGQEYPHYELRETKGTKGNPHLRYHLKVTRSPSSPFYRFFWLGGWKPTKIRVQTQIDRKKMVPTYNLSTGGPSMSFGAKNIRGSDVLRGEPQGQEYPHYEPREPRETLISGTT